MFIGLIKRIQEAMHDLYPLSLDSLGCGGILQLYQILLVKYAEPSSLKTAKE